MGSALRRLLHSKSHLSVVWLFFSDTIKTFVRHTRPIVLISPYRRNGVRIEATQAIDHNTQCRGKAVFSDAIPEETQQSMVGKNAAFMLGYTTSDFPADLNGDKDIESYRRHEAQPPGLVVNTGTVLRYVDVAPGSLSPMHRTVSLDYGIVLEGEMELVLDSGETRRMAVGDVAIQRGTMHAWRNAGSSWARMVYILQPCKPVVVAGGASLKEDYSDMEGVPPST